MADYLAHIPMVDSIVRSNLTASDKSQLTSMLQVLQQSPLPPVPEQPSRGNMLGQFLQSGIVGGGLGIMEAELKEGLDVNGVPVDLVLSCISELGALFYRSVNSHEVAKEAMTVYTFRTTSKVLTAIKARRAAANDSSESNPQAAE